MNLAHLHLVLNHIPIVGIPVALAFLAQGLWVRNPATHRFSLIVLFVLSVMVLPVFFTGEPAEEVVEHLPGVAESFIEAHEEAAKFSLVLTLLSGAVAFIALWFQRDEKKARLLNLGVMGVATLAIVSLLYTAKLGGEVRHTEFRSGSPTQTEGPAADNEKDGDND